LSYDNQSAEELTYRAISGTRVIQYYDHREYVWVDIPKDESRVFGITYFDIKQLRIKPVSKNQTKGDTHE